MVTIRSFMPAPSPPRLTRFAQGVVRRRRLVVIAWVLALVGAFALAPTIKGQWSADYSTPGSDSKTAINFIKKNFPHSSAETLDVVWQAPAGALSPGAKAHVASLIAKLTALKGVQPSTTIATAQVAPNGTTAVLRLPLTERPANVATDSGPGVMAVTKSSNIPGVTVALGGQVVQNAERGSMSSEAIGLAVALIILLLTFGTVVAAGLPIVTALFGLEISGVLIGGLASLMSVPDWSQQVAAMLGIGVGIDYSLLILTRYRTGLAAGREPSDAIIRAVSPAGRSVLIPGPTVVVSMLGLFLMGLPYPRGVALSASLGVLIVMLASITLLPAIVAMAGRKTEALRIPFSSGRRARRAAAHASAPATDGFAGDQS